MQIQELIKQAAVIRDHVQAAQEEAEIPTPHLATAAGHLAQAVRCLEGHLQATAPVDLTPRAEH